MSWNPPGWDPGSGTPSAPPAPGGSTTTVIIYSAGAPGSEVQIANLALSKLGADPIINFGEDNVRARTMALFYQPTLEAELHKYRWKFSIRRTSLPALAAVPISDFARQFNLPNDYLRLIEGGDIVDVADMSDYRMGGMALYSIEGRVLLTNLGAPLLIRYIARVSDTALMNPSFVEALASRLAFVTCERITQSSSKKADARADYKDSIREAIRANAIEAPPQSVSDDTWIAARAM